MITANGANKISSNANARFKHSLMNGSKFKQAIDILEKDIIEEAEIGGTFILGPAWHLGILHHDNEGCCLSQVITEYMQSLGYKMIFMYDPSGAYYDFWYRCSWRK
jgi:hypothetical protein